MEKTNPDVFNITTGARKYKEISLGFTAKGLVVAVRFDGQNYEPGAASNYFTGADSCEGLGVFNARAEGRFAVGPFSVPVNFLSGLTEETAAAVLPSRIEAVRAALKEFLSVRQVVDLTVPSYEGGPIDFRRLDKGGAAS